MIESYLNHIVPLILEIRHNNSLYYSLLDPSTALLTKFRPKQPLIVPSAVAAVSPPCRRLNTSEISETIELVLGFELRRCLCARDTSIYTQFLLD